MREILFRGKTDKGEWVYGFYVYYVLSPLPKQQFHRITTGKEKGYGATESYDVIPETIGQYTGLTDKNGTKVFEGDIVKYGDTINKVVFENRNGTAYFGVVMDIAETWHFCYLTNAECMEVIGNIHDNPELLKECEG